MIRRLGLVLLLAFITAAALRAEDFTGRWEGWPTLPDGTTFKLAFVFSAGSDGKLTCSVETSDFGTFTATDLVVDGDKITFDVPTDGGIYHNVGTLKPEGLLLEGTGPEGAVPPVLYKRPAADLAGTWRGTIQFPDEAAEVVYTFIGSNGQFTGTSRSPMGEVPLTAIKVDGPRVSFESELSGFTIKRRGTITGDKLELTVTIDGNEFAVTFTRDPAAPAPTP